MTTDKSLLRDRFAASFKKYDTLAVVQQRISEQLAEMISRICGGEISRGLEIGAGTGFLTRRLLQQYPKAQWTINDLVEESAAFIVPHAGSTTIEYCWGDAETVDLPNDLDLIATASTVQWFDDLPGFLNRMAGFIHPRGFLALSTFGPDNFHQIKSTTGEGLEYYDSDKLAELFHHNGWEIKEHLEYTKKLIFPTPVEVLHHIKATGVNSIHRTRWTKRNLADFEIHYKELFSENSGEVGLTYHPILIIAQKK